MEIKTKRLTLTPLGIKYLKSVHEYASDSENTAYMVRLPNENIEETKEFLAGADAEWQKDKKQFFEFAVIFESIHIGAVSIYLDKENAGELGWIINKKYWNRGFAYEAAQALLNFAVNELHISHFIAHCDCENTASYKIMEKLDMKRTCINEGRKNRGSDEERREYQYELFIN